MIAFIDAHRKVHGVEPICRLLPIAPSTYHEQAARSRNPDRMPARRKRDIILCRGHRQVGWGAACGMWLSQVAGRDDDTCLPELRRLPFPG